MEMKDILRVISTTDVINVLETHLSTSEVEGIMSELLGRELWIKNSTIEILEDFWREKSNEGAN